MQPSCTGPAFVVSNSIWNYYEGRFGGEAAIKAGYPTADAVRWGAGYAQDFQGGSWGPVIIMVGDGVGRVHLILGGIRNYYLSVGHVYSWLGYPTSEEFQWNGGVRQDFQGGSLFWTSSGGVRPI
jgi:hypothetical protein